MLCPHCGLEIPGQVIARELGLMTSPKKAAACRENGKKGGRPPKNQKNSVHEGKINSIPGSKLLSKKGTKAKKPVK